jgi:hypothetical protein
LRDWGERIRGDRALVVGLLGGSVTSLAGVVAYVLLPYLRGQASGLATALVDGAVGFTGFSPLYHAVVLVIVPFVTTVVAVSVARRRGLSTRVHDLKVVGSIVLAPFTTVVVLYFVGAVGVGLAMGSSGDNFALYERLLGIAGMTGFALIFGTFFLLIVGVVVLVGELVGAGSGYLLARRLSRR